MLTVTLIHACNYELYPYRITKAQYKTIEEADEHMDTGHHIMPSERDRDHIRQRTQAMGSCNDMSKIYWPESWQDRLCSFGELPTEQRVGLKEAESCGENIFGCQRIFDKFIQRGS